MSDVEHIYSTANSHAQTVQVCIDRLHELGANEQLKLLTGRLQKLAARATAGVKPDQRQARRPQNLKGGQRSGSRYATGRPFKLSRNLPREMSRSPVSITPQAFEIARRRAASASAAAGVKPGDWQSSACMPSIECETGGQRHQAPPGGGLPVCTGPDCKKIQKEIGFPRTG